MHACESDINRLAKVRYLDEKGANCQAKDHVRCCLFATNSINKSPVFFIQDGQTALFYAILPSKCEDDEVKDVLRYLVIEKGIDINSVDEVTFLRYFAFLFVNPIIRRERHPYCTHVIRIALLSLSFSN